jgi:Skp family chaperone for outer membrane proteins
MRGTAEQAAWTEPVTLDKAQLQTLSAVIQHAPTLALNAANLLTRTYVLRFSPEVTAQLAAGTARIMPWGEGGIRAIAVNQSGTIIGQGALIPVSAMRVATMTVVAWQALAIITAQHYLADIQDRLAAIETRLNKIQRWLEDREIATLQQNFAHLESYRDVLQRRQLTDDDIHTFGRKIEHIDQIERECGQVQKTFGLSMKRCVARFEALPIAAPYWGTVKKQVGSAVELINEYEGYACAFLFAIMAQAAAMAIRGILPQSPADHDLGIQRLHDVQEELRAWRQDSRQFIETIRQRAEEARARTDVRDSLRNERSRLKGAADVLQARLTRAYDPGWQSLQQVAQQLNASRQPLTLLVELNEQGQIVHVARPQQPQSAITDATERNTTGSAELIACIIERLRRVSGMTDANWDDVVRSSKVLVFSNGINVSTWTNPARVVHVFVSDRQGACRYAGFVGWIHTKGLQKAIKEIQQLGDCIRLDKSLLSAEPDEKRKPARRSSRPKRMQ